MTGLSVQDAIKRIPLLATLKEGTRAELLKRFSLERFPSGAHVIVMGDLGKDVLLMAHGRAHVTRCEQNGKEAIIAELKEGALFGEIAVLTGGDRSAFVVAASDCAVLRLAREDFEHILLLDLDFTRNLLGSMAERLRAAGERIADLALLDVNDRVLKVLKDLSETTNKQGGYTSVVQNRPTHANLANMAGTSREVVTRALKRLQEEDKIALSGNKVYLR